MKISQVSILTGASIKAIRLYEKMGLLDTVERNGKYRSFTTRDINHIRLIRAAQSFGFKLAEISEIKGSGDLPHWSGILEALIAKQAKLRENITQLQLMDQQLQMLIADLQICADGLDEQLDVNDIECDYMSSFHEPFKG